jgi:hypothetical protein
MGNPPGIHFWPGLCVRELAWKDRNQLKGSHPATAPQRPKRVAERR